MFIKQISAYNLKLALNKKKKYESSPSITRSKSDISIQSIKPLHPIPELLIIACRTLEFLEDELFIQLVTSTDALNTSACKIYLSSTKYWYAPMFQIHILE